jgi:hypothetical protein
VSRTPAVIRFCYFYSWDDPSAGHQADVLTRDEALHMAATFARLPELLKRPDVAHHVRAKPVGVVIPSARLAGNAGYYDPDRMSDADWRVFT